MDSKTWESYQWAKNQNYQSVAARHAARLADWLDRIGKVEHLVPDWDVRFPTIADALKHSIERRDGIINHLRAKQKGA